MCGGNCHSITPKTAENLDGGGLPLRDQECHCHFSHCRQYFMSGCGEETRHACHASTAMPELRRVDRCKGAEEHNVDSASKTGSYVADCGTSEESNARAEHRSSKPYVPSALIASGTCGLLEESKHWCPPPRDRVTRAATLSSRDGILTAPGCDGERGIYAPVTAQ